MAFLVKIAIFRPNIELEGIGIQSVEAKREVICAYFGNIGRNSGYFLLPIFLGSYLSEQSQYSTKLTEVNLDLNRTKNSSRFFSLIALVLRISFNGKSLNRKQSRKVYPISTWVKVGAQTNPVGGLNIAN